MLTSKTTRLMLAEYQPRSCSYTHKILLEYETCNLIPHTGTINFSVSVINHLQTVIPLELKFSIKY